MDFTNSKQETTLRNRILKRNFLIKKQSMQFSDDLPIHQDYNTLVENVLNFDFQQAFDGCYDREHVNPVKWCKDYQNKYNELLCEKFGQSYSPFTTTKKIAIGLDMHPDGKIQAMLDFLRIHN